MNILDERERQEVSQVEHRGLIAGYVLLLAAIVVQVLKGAPFRQYAGEALVTLGMSVCMIAGYARFGIWDTGAAPGIKDNLLCSGLCAISVGVLSYGITGNGVTAVLLGSAAFLIALGMLTVMLKWVQKRRRAQEEAYASDDEE
jgi:hypothetical protein